MRLLALLASIWAVAALAVPAQAKRVALVIANAGYANATPLRNPAADARLLAGSLKQAGFDTVTVKGDLTKTALEAELRAFGERAEGADVALVYYAGHGIEAGGQNYLIPVDAKLIRDRDLDVEATRLDTALLMTEGARLKIIVLDACRNNPFAASMQRSMRNRAIGRGLAQVEPEGETLVVFAAKAGSTAADGDGANSPFAEALAKRLPQPGLEISLLFRNVRDDVLAKTGRTQEPFTYGSLSGQAFYFRPPASETTAANSASPAAPGLSAAANETAFWQDVQKVNSIGAFRSYVSRYPDGRFVALAYGNIKKLTQPDAGPGMIGVQVSTMTTDEADALGLSAPQGELVQWVAPGRPAFAAGIIAGDVITKVNGTRLSAEADLTSIVSNLLVDSNVPIEFSRNGKKLIATAKIADGSKTSASVPDLSDENPVPESSLRAAPVSVDSLGVSVTKLDPSVGRTFGLGQERGLFLIRTVKKSGSGEARGLAGGDILMSFNNQIVDSVQDIERIAAAARAAGRSHIMARVKRIRKFPVSLAIKID